MPTGSPGAPPRHRRPVLEQSQAMDDHDREQLVAHFIREAEVWEEMHRSSGPRGNPYSSGLAEGFRRAAKFITAGHCGYAQCEVCGRLTKIEGETHRIQLDGDTYLVHSPPRRRVDG
jgi:hypothetical protein